MFQRYLAVVTGTTPIASWAKGLCLLATIGWVDYLTGYELAFPGFFILPVFVVSWSGKRASGIGCAMLCAGVWFLADTMSHHPYTSEFYRYWNLLIRFFVYSIVSLLVSQIRVLLEQEKGAKNSLRLAYEQVAAAQQQVLAESAAKVKALDELRHADRLKTVGRLASGIAHELGTPLNVISGRINFILSGNLDRDQLHRNAKIIDEQTERMALIVQHLLDFARQQTANAVVLDIRALIARTLDLLRPLGEKQGVSMVYQPPKEPFVTKVDSPQIQQVLTNLILNAVQAMPAGGNVEVAVQRTMARPPDEPGSELRAWACISVADEGEGISEENMAHLFEPFFTTKDIGHGTGLGLSIAYGIVHEHGGWIEATSQRGNGSLFCVYLPLED